MQTFCPICDRYVNGVHQHSNCPFCGKELANWQTPCKCRTKTRTKALMELVTQYRASKTADEGFALSEAIENGIERMENEIHLLAPKVCCQDFANCKDSDCIPLLRHKLSAKESEAMDERRERQYWTQECERQLHKVADAEQSLSVALTRLECAFIEADNLRMEIVGLESDLKATNAPS